MLQCLRLVVTKGDQIRLSITSLLGAFYREEVVRPKKGHSFRFSGETHLASWTSGIDDGKRMFFFESRNRTACRIV